VKIEPKFFTTTINQEGNQQHAFLDQFGNIWEFRHFWDFQKDQAMEGWVIAAKLPESMEENGKFKPAE
jgi:hypothetical protein